MKGGFSVSTDVAGFDRQMDLLAADAESAARPAAQAMAQVLYEAVQSNVTRLKRHTGKLAAAIYQAYSKDQSTPTHPVYHVSWNARKAPHGHLVEWGHLQRYEIVYDKAAQRFVTTDRLLPQPKLVAARPFVRPAIAQFEKAREAGRQRYLQVLAEKGIVR